MPAHPSKSQVRRLTPKLREAIELRLHQGASGLSIVKEYSLPLTTYVSACKAHPFPGGVLDPKGQHAKYAGEWLDWDGFIREWKGFDKQGQPRRDGYSKPPNASKFPRIGIAGESTPARIVKEVVAKRPIGRPRKTPPAKVLTFGTSPIGARAGSSETEDLEPALVAGSEAPSAEGPSTGQGPSLPPDAQHAGKPQEDLGEPLEDFEGGRATPRRQRGSRMLRNLRAKLKKLIPLDLHAKKIAQLVNSESDATVAKGLQMYHDVMGITAQTKDQQADRALGTAPIFQLPKGTSVGFQPLRPKTSALPDPDSDPETGT